MFKLCETILMGFISSFLFLIGVFLINISHASLIALAILACGLIGFLAIAIDRSAFREVS